MLRPDGMVATAVHLGKGEGLEKYFNGILSGGLRSAGDYDCTLGTR